MTRLNRSVAVLVLTLGLCAVVSAQTLSGQFSPNPALVGQTITFTLTDSTGNGFMASSSSCYGRTVLDGPGGAIVFAPMVCTMDIILVPPNGSWTVTWDQTDNLGQQVTADTYWFAAAANGVTNYFPISILAGSTERSLLNTAPVQVGQYVTLLLQSPNDPGAPYQTVFSLSTNEGFNSHAGFAALDQDFLFELSVAAQPTWIFGNTIGTLDFTGNSAPVYMLIPNFASLAYKGLAAQAVLIDSLGQLQLTNPMTFTIAP